MRPLLVAVALLVSAWVHGAGAPPVRVLFIGNGPVATAGVPSQLQRLAARMGREARVEAVALDDQPGDDALARLAAGWDFVVLQPPSRPASRAAWIEEARRAAAAVRAAGARPVLFSAWPARSGRAEFPAAIASHRRAATEADALLIPAAETWLRVMNEDPSLDLYAGRAQASAAGATLALLATWFTLFPAGPHEFDEAYVAKLAAALDIPGPQRDRWVDAATRALDEPMRLN